MMVSIFGLNDEVPVAHRSRSKAKPSGQECPLHTSSFIAFRLFEPLEHLQIYWPADFELPPLPLNSSAIQCCKAVMFCGRPSKFFTRSLADMEPPGSRTTRR